MSNKHGLEFNYCYTYQCSQCGTDFEDKVFKKRTGPLNCAHCNIEMDLIRFWGINEGNFLIEGYYIYDSATKNGKVK